MKQIDFLLEWLGTSMLPCYFKTMYGFDCPGCGGQRAILFLFKGDFAASFTAYPPLFPIIFMLLLYVFNKRIQYVNKEIIFKVLAWALAVLVFFNWGWKLAMV